MHTPTNPTGFRCARALSTLVLAASAVVPLRAQSDACADAELVNPGVYQGDTSELLKDGSSTCGTTARSPDAWYSYTADRDCLLIVSTCGSRYDTVVSVHSGCPGTPENQIVCNDDVCGLQSRAGVIAQAGETYFIRVSGFGGARGNYTLEISCVDLPEGDGPDLVVSDLDGLRQIARRGDIVALSVESTLCNAGGLPVDWLHNPDPRHPFLVFNAYRLFHDRLEQIGQSWVKHGFAASNVEACGGGCIPLSINTSLGLGCADIYSVMVNSSQEHMGPRPEVNPWTGEFSFEGSHLQVLGRHEHDAVEHRLQIRDADFDPIAYPGASYFLELFVTSHDDADHTNSIGWERFFVDGRTEGSWRLSLEDGPSKTGPALDAWTGAARAVIPEEPLDDGRAHFAAKAAANADGTWRYEYALYNLDMARGIRSVTIPLPLSVKLANIDFHAPWSDGDGFSNAPWTAERTAAGLTWRTAPFDDPEANPVRWGTLYNFRFDADAFPGEGTVALEAFLPGDPAEYKAATITPSAEPSRPRFRRGDVDISGAVDLTDVILMLRSLFAAGPGFRCSEAADMDDSGRINSADAVFALNWLFVGGPPPPPPGPITCGIDPTPQPDRPCTYDPAKCGR